MFALRFCFGFCSWILGIESGTAKLNSGSGFCISGWITKESVYQHQKLNEHCRKKARFFCRKIKASFFFVLIHSKNVWKHFDPNYYFLQEVKICKSVWWPKIGRCRSRRDLRRAWCPECRHIRRRVCLGSGPHLKYLTTWSEGLLWGPGNPSSPGPEAHPPTFRGILLEALRWPFLWATSLSAPKILL